MPPIDMTSLSEIGDPPFGSTSIDVVPDRVGAETTVRGPMEEPGARVPPLLMVTAPEIVPEPPRVPPLLTETGLASEPFTRNVPALTVVVWSYVQAPPSA